MKVILWTPKEARPELWFGDEIYADDKIDELKRHYATSSLDIFNSIKEAVLFADAYSGEQEEAVKVLIGGIDENLRLSLKHDDFCKENGMEFERKLSHLTIDDG